VGWEERFEKRRKEEEKNSTKVQFFSFFLLFFFFSFFLLLQFLLLLLRHTDTHQMSATDTKEHTLWQACADGNLSLVKTLCSDPSVNVNYFDSEHLRTPFTRACGFGRLDIVEYLLQVPTVNITLPQGDGANPLWMAAQYSFLPVVQLLLASGREIDLHRRAGGVGQNWRNKTALEVAVMASTRARYTDETEAEYKNAKLTGPVIAKLLQDFGRDPAKVRQELRELPGLREPYIAKLFAIVVFLCDDFLRLASNVREDNRQQKAQRFFAIALQLPMELQMTLCNRVHKSPKDIVLTKHSEPAFQELVVLGLNL